MLHVTDRIEIACMPAIPAASSVYSLLSLHDQRVVTMYTAVEGNRV